RGAMMAASPSAAGGFTASGLSVKKSEEIADLIDLFSKIQYRAKEVTPRVEAIEKRCLDLFARDYKYSIIHNANGEVCGHYPRQIVFLEYECTDVERDRFESTVQISKLQDLVNRSKLARCRGRFVCPVILYNGKHICRSSTLAGWGELYGRTGYNYIFSGTTHTCTQLKFNLNRGSCHDIKLLRYLSVRYICDLMVENKKVKFGLNVTSSEKADKAQRYADFTLLSVPYPGCEFFKDYKDRDYTAEGLVFNWNQDYVDAPLTIPVCFTQNLNIDWTQYQSWDLVEQTQNYLKLLLHIINIDDESGLLVHCISGWDRTPLFVSLLRLSLWADGAVHASLEPAQILYLTIAYDWFLFGACNDLCLVAVSPLSSNMSFLPQIFFFCFNFLKHIVSEKFSAVRKQRCVPPLCHYALYVCYVLYFFLFSFFPSFFLSFSIFFLLNFFLFLFSIYLSFFLSFHVKQSLYSAMRKGTTSSPQMVVWNKQNPLEEHLSHPLNEARSSSSSSSNQSEHGVTRTGSSPLAVPGRRLAADYTRSGSSLSTEYGSWQIVSGCGTSSTSSAVAAAYDSPLPFSFQDEGPSGRMCPFPSERQARLEAVREVFLAAYSSTVGLKSSAPSPSGAISGLLEQFARGVGLRGTNAIV
uniref:Myotubularin related protein 14 n=1 Tax=Dicentrarchus labrax TaxID=13489 RepID=A0A8P4KS40_DICLA